MKNLFKYASLLAAAAMLFSCEEFEPEVVIPENPLVISTDKNFIQTFGGDFATLTVTYEGEVVKDDVSFLDGNNKLVELKDFKFSSTVAGDYEFRAIYGTATSDKIMIRAISEQVPATPDDPNPNSTSFKARVLVSEFTTVGCTACPAMKRNIHGAVADADVADKVILTECHSGLVNSQPDRAYVKTTYDKFAKTGGFPHLFCDMYYSTANYTSWTSANIAKIFNDCYNFKNGKAAGIAVNSVLHEGNKLITKVTVKAAVSGAYYVGAFLLEDGIYEKQLGKNTDETYMDTHDGVIRYIDAMESENGSEHYFGHPAGKIEAGKTADYVFVMELDKIWTEGSKNGEDNGGRPWEVFKMENLRLAVFTCTGTDKDGYYLSNVISTPINGQLQFEYNK